MKKVLTRIGVGILVIGLLGTLMWACSIFSLPNHAFLSVDRLTYKISNASLISRPPCRDAIRRYPSIQMHSGFALVGED